MLCQQTTATTIITIDVVKEAVTKVEGVEAEVDMEVRGDVEISNLLTNKVNSLHLRPRKRIRGPHSLLLCQPRKKTNHDFFVDL
jgi:predicted PilT family ATPase